MVKLISERCLPAAVSECLQIIFPWATLATLYWPKQLQTGVFVQLHNQFHVVKPATSTSPGRHIFPIFSCRDRRLCSICQQVSRHVSLRRNRVDAKFVNLTNRYLMAAWKWNEKRTFNKSSHKKSVQFNSSSVYIAPIHHDSHLKMPNRLLWGN